MIRVYRIHSFDLDMAAGEFVMGVTVQREDVGVPNHKPVPDPLDEGFLGAGSSKNVAAITL